ncbi:MAG: Crp/Fnr family transcriptional regulator [Anaerolineae bacterium]|nr:Crp/Fnr family transcriptional regulator [Anaerolineae bacterium]MDQ7035806.1 Crp/Fnr family transcriptional regulator [Anaerolineae bacterium]
MSDDLLNSLKNTLATIPYFANLDAALIETIVQQTKQRQYDTGQFVFLEGEEDVALYIVHSGWLKAIKMSPDGREQILHFFGAGAVFNMIGVFAEVANPATVIALEPSTLWVIQQAVMLKLLDDHPKLARIIIQRLAKRVKHLVNLVEDLSLRTIESRLARYLIEESTAEQLQRPRWATQAEIANRLGTVPDVLNRALRNLAKENLIRVERHQIQILDYTGLETKAELGK